MTLARERSGTAPERAGAAAHAARRLDQDLWAQARARIGWTVGSPCGRRVARAGSTVDTHQRPVRCPAGEGEGRSTFPSATAVSMPSLPPCSWLLHTSPSRISDAVAGVLTETDRTQEGSPTRNRRRPGGGGRRRHLQPRSPLRPPGRPRHGPMGSEWKYCSAPDSRTTDQEKTRLPSSPPHPRLGGVEVGTPNMDV